MTVGLLIVSHSARIAEGVAELAGQMAEGVAIVPAGGTDDGGIGTSFDRVVAGLAEADTGDGVVVLCDLGSAVLTAETALDLAEDPDRIRIADAPIVEGAVAAAVAAAQGDPLAAVLEAAESALGVEAQREAAWSAAASGPSAADDASGRTRTDAASGTDDVATLDVMLETEHGLHLRPASELVRALSGLDARTTVEGVDATSLLRVCALGLERGQTAHFVATGRDAHAAIAAIRELAERGFGEA